MNKRIIWLGVGNILAIALGMSVARAWHRQDGKPIVSESTLRAPRASSSENGAEPARILRRSKPVELRTDAGVFKGAWQEMQRQSAADRARLRPALLAKWAEVDLAGALDAALLEPDAEELLLVFDGLFKNDPDAFRPLLAGEQFGLKSAQLRDWWITHMSASNPDGLLASIADFNESDQRKIVGQCADGMTGDPDRMWGMVGDLAKLPDTAAKLPERDDTMDLYRVAVRKYVTYQPDEARQWIGKMPNGWKQQNSLTSYAQSALFARSDVEGAEWARKQIADPRFRAEVDGMFKTYEQKTKGK